MKVKVGDNVKIIAGKDKGKEGKVIKTFKNDQKVVKEEKKAKKVVKAEVETKKAPAKKTTKKATKKDGE